MSRFNQVNGYVVICCHKSESIWSRLGIGAKQYLHELLREKSQFATS